MFISCISFLPTPASERISLHGRCALLSKNTFEFPSRQIIINNTHLLSFLLWSIFHSPSCFNQLLWFLACLNCFYFKETILIQYYYYVKIIVSKHNYIFSSINMYAEWQSGYYNEIRSIKWLELHTYINRLAAVCRAIIWVHTRNTVIRHLRISTIKSKMCVDEHEQWWNQNWVVMAGWEC